MSDDTNKVVDLTTILAERDNQYGSFKKHAMVAQQLKAICFQDPDKYNDAQAEALEMILHKIARIVNGNPNHMDSWVDIAGYARVVYEDK